MHKMQTIVTNDHGVCQSVSLPVMQLNLAVHAVSVGSFGAAIAIPYWPLVIINSYISTHKKCKCRC